MGNIASSTVRPSLALFCMLLPLTGCAAMNQVTALDRFFEPDRYGTRAAPARGARPAPPARPATTPTVVAMAPRPDPVPLPAALRPPPAEPGDPEAGLRQTVRQHPWLTRFWSELQPAEQARIARELPAAEDLPGRWDSMGLADRARVVAPPSDERRWASRP